jgi:hypothetical protein
VAELKKKISVFSGRKGLKQSGNSVYTQNFVIPLLFIVSSPLPVLPGGRHHGHFPQMWQFKIIIGRGKFVSVSGRKVAVKGPKRLKCGRGK